MTAPPRRPRRHYPPWWQSRGRRPPPWWPQGEAWPPRRGRHRPLPALLFPLFVFGLVATLLIGALNSSPALRWAAVAVTGFLAFAIFSAARAASRIARGMADRRRSEEAGRRRFMADAAHELRTPLAVIRAQAEGIADGLYRGDAAHLAPILDATRSLERLVEDLRILSESESGTVEPSLQPLDVAELLAEVQAAHGRAATDAAITILVEGPGATVEADPDRLRQVLDNLITNALRHTPRGGVVRLAARPDGGGVLIEVADTGPGIAPELLPRIFERFVKGADSPGSGLGLAIAAELVRAQGGEIEAASKPGRGATFTIRLP